MGVSIKDISRVTNLSLGTVSNYLNGKKIKDENRAAIEDAIESLGYRLNSFGRNLKTNRSQIIGVVLPYLDDVFSAKIVSNMEDWFRQEGYAVIISDTKGNPVTEQAVFSFFAERRVDGIICFPTSTSAESYREWLKKDVPVVFLDTAFEGENADFVTVDNEKLSRIAAEYLISKGHRKIGVLCGPEGVFSADERLRGYRNALEAHGVPFSAKYVRRGEYTRESVATELAAELLREEDAPTAIFATNYYFTLGTVVAANVTGNTVGKDFSLFGFDNLMTVNLIQPKLSLVEQPLEEMARVAAFVLVERIRGEGGLRKVYLLDGRLEEGDSVRDLKVT